MGDGVGGQDVWEELEAESQLGAEHEVKLGMPPFRRAPTASETVAGQNMSVCTFQ